MLPHIFRPIQKGEEYTFYQKIVFPFEKGIEYSKNVWCIQYITKTVFCQSVLPTFKSDKKKFVLSRIKQQRGRYLPSPLSYKFFSLTLR